MYKEFYSQEELEKFCQENKDVTSLVLGFEYDVTDISPLANLTSLKSLDFSRCTSLTDLSPLANLTSLERLNLWGCERLTDLSPLANLTSLTELDLSWCESLDDLTPLAKLISLTRLDLSWCERLSMTEIENIKTSLPDCEVYCGKEDIR